MLCNAIGCNALSGCSGVWGSMSGEGVDGWMGFMDRWVVGRWVGAWVSGWMDVWWVGVWVFGWMDG